MSVSKIDWTRQPRAYVFNTLGSESIGPVTTVGAGVVNTTVQAGVQFPTYVKIIKVGFFVGAIDTVAGTDLFNLVVGTGTYTSAAASVAGNDNSFAQTLQGGTAAAPGLGYVTNPAVAGNTIFGADVAMTAANFPGLTTSGGYGVLVPPSYDAVYPPTLPITLRVTSTASTGSIANLLLTLLVEPVTYRPFWQTPANPQVLPIPGIAF